MYAVGDKFSLEITDFTQEASGVGHEDSGLAVFVPYALPGDLVEVEVTRVKKNYLEARKTKLLKPSPERRQITVSKPDLEAAPLIELSPEAEKNWKLNLVQEQLRRLAGLEPQLQYISTEEFHYRNKCNLRVNADGLLCQSLRRSNELLPLDGSILFLESINNIIALWNHYARSNKILQKQKAYIPEVVIRSNAQAETMLYLKLNNPNETFNELETKNLLNSLVYLPCQVKAAQVLTSEKTSNSQAAKAKKATSATSKPNSGSRTGKAKSEKKIIFASPKHYLTETINGLTIRISPDSFLQTNNFALNYLYDSTRKFTAFDQAETVLDLYCGIGISSLSMAKKVSKVIAVEVVEAAIEDAKLNARNNAIANVKFIAGRAEDLLEDIFRQNEIKKVLVDPPRKGLDRAVTAKLISMQVPEILYISCNPSTLARDLKEFSDNAYIIKDISVFNQFPNTTHVETVVLLGRE